MAEVLRNSLAIIVTSSGFTCQYYSCRPTGGYRIHCSCFPRCLCYNSTIKTNKKQLKGHGVDTISLRENGRSQFEVTGHIMMEMNLLFGSERRDTPRIVSNMVACAQSGLVCEEDEENMLNQRRKEEFDPSYFEQKFPPLGNSEIHKNPDFEHIGVAEPLTISTGISSEFEDKLHFLEERNEQILSKRILMLSRSNKVRSVLELYRTMEFSGLQPSSHACNSLLSCLLRNEMLDDALRVFESMKANESTTGHSYSLVLKAIANIQGYDSALKMFSKLEVECKVKKDFDVIAYTTMISICGKVNNWAQTERIWRSMKENGLVGTIVTYRLLVSVFVRCGQNELAIDAYSEMIQNGLKPGEDAMKAIIGACAKEGKWDLALSVFQSMLNVGLKPNLIACNALINSIGKSGNVKLAFRVYDVMKSLGHTPDVYTWNALLGALYRANQHADALHLFESIREQSSQVNLHLYNTALMSCQKLGLWNRALQLLWQMEASGLSVSSASYNLVIGACEVARKPEIALQVYEHMVQQQCTPDTFTHLSLIRSCIWGSLWAEVKEILNRAGTDVSLYNAAIQGMCLRGKIESAKKLYMRMRKSGLKPDGKTRALMLQNLQKDAIRPSNRRFSHPRRY